MWAKRFIALTLFATLAAMPACVSRAQWVQTNGPYGGQVNCFALSDTTIFAGTHDGVFRSTNNGASWTAANHGLSNSFIESIAIKGKNLFAGTYGGGVYLSNDNGSSWIEESMGLSENYVTALVVSDSNVFAGTSDSGVFISTNNGQSWTSVNLGLKNTMVLSLAEKGTNLFVGTNGGGIFLSTNSVASWASVNSGLTNTLAFDALVTDDSNIFTGNSDGVFQSTDNGKSWTNIIHFDNVNVQALAFRDSDLFIATAGAVSHWKLGPQNWTIVNQNLTQNATSISIEGTRIFAGTYNGVYFTIDSGASWKERDSGLNASFVQSIAMSGPNLLAGTFDLDNRIFLSVDDGTTWMPAANPLPQTTYVLTFASIGQKQFAGTIDGLYLSTNNGESWSRVENNDLPVNVVQAFASIGSNFFIGTGGEGVYLTSDSGSTWAEVNSGFDSRDITALAVIDTNLFAATASSGVYLSTNNGTTWEVVNSGLAYENVQALSVIGKNIFAGTYSNGIFVSSNNGTNWVALDTMFLSTEVFGFGVIGTDLLVGTSNGVFLSTNNGSTWKPMNVGLTNLNVCAFAINDTNIFAATLGGGIWRCPLSDFGISSVAQAPVTAQCDIQSYPNPFSNSTQISFTSPDAGYAYISVVNLLGEQVARVFSGELDAGEHNFTFNNTAGLLEGVYDCLLRMNGRIETLPIVLLH